MFSASALEAWSKIKVGAVATANVAANQAAKAKLQAEMMYLNNKVRLGVTCIRQSDPFSMLG